MLGNSNTQPLAIVYHWIMSGRVSYLHFQLGSGLRLSMDNSYTRYFVKTNAQTDQENHIKEYLRQKQNWSSHSTDQRNPYNSKNRTNFLISSTIYTQIFVRNDFWQEKKSFQLQDKPKVISNWAQNWRTSCSESLLPHHLALAQLRQQPPRPPSTSNPSRQPRDRGERGERGNEEQADGGHRTTDTTWLLRLHSWKSTKVPVMNGRSVVSGQSQTTSLLTDNRSSSSDCNILLSFSVKVKTAEYFEN